MTNQRSTQGISPCPQRREIQIVQLDAESTDGGVQCGPKWITSFLHQEDARNKNSITSIFKLKQQQK